MAVNMMRSFKKYKLSHTAAAVFYAPAAFYWLHKDKAEYDGPNYIKEKEFITQLTEARKSGNKREIDKLKRNSPYIKSGGREWIESIFFAVFAAAFIRMFLIEAFVIPTPSMEGSLMVGDFLFVSKPSYGIRTPMTVAMLPLVHNQIPILNTESYLKKPKLGYHRLPALENIKRNKPFVFNWPVGDTVFITDQRSYTLGQVTRNKSIAIQDPQLGKMMRKNDYVVRPIDKKDHYIKRCVALPGDTLQIINRQIHINGEQTKNPKHIQYAYAASGIGGNVSPKKLEQLNIAQTLTSYRGNPKNPSGLYINQEQHDALKGLSDKIQLKIVEHAPSPLQNFPHDPKNFPDWSIDNYGPIWIPKAGETVSISAENIALYRRIISVYEGNDFEMKGGEIFINGEQATEYTFKQDYYWAMGDNRHNSEDSRSWGFVPYDHIVGKPLFIWFSTKNAKISNGIRFNRMFKSASSD